MSKTNKEQIDEHFKAIDYDNALISKLYDHKIVNWSGKLSGEDQYYSDYIAEKILDLIDLFEELDNKPKRKKPYLVKGHHGVTEKVTNRKEEVFAKSLLDHELEGLGRIIDYQVPLKGVQGDDYGKIDLVSVTPSGSEAYLIELKIGNKETLLRAALELQTYSELIDEQKLRKELYKKISVKYHQNHALFKAIKKNGIGDIKKAVLFALEGEDDLPKELNKKYSEKYKSLKELIDGLGIAIFTISQSYPTQKAQIG